MRTPLNTHYSKSDLVKGYQFDYSFSKKEAWRFSRKIWVRSRNHLRRKPIATAPT